MHTEIGAKFAYRPLFNCATFFAFIIEKHSKECCDLVIPNFPCRDFYGIFRVSTIFYDFFVLFASVFALDLMSGVT